VCQKEALGRPHLRTLHAWCGTAAWSLWGAAYVAAQPQVWRDQWRQRRFSLLSNKRWLWSDSTHRRLGVLAFGAALTAYASGLLGWRALPPLVARCCAGLVALIGASTLGGHGLRESGRALRAAALPPARLVRGMWREGVPRGDD